MSWPGAPALGLVLLLSELALRVGRRSAGTGATPADRSSLTVLWLTILAALGLGALAPRWAPGLNYRLSPLGQGVAVVVFGVALALRWWAVLSLGRFFTVDVAIHADHELVTSGPYRWVRHPSYTALLAAFAALAALYGNLLSLAIILVPIALALLFRIRVEEQALSRAFGAAWTAHCRQRKALLPGLL